MEHHDIDLMEKVSERFEKHVRFPVSLGAIEDAQGKATGVGSCGDAIEISIHLDGETISAIGHVPNGCAYTIACASAVCSLANGRTVDEALTLSPDDVARELDGLPDDHLHCARLAVNTLGEAVAEAYKTIAKDKEG